MNEELKKKLFTFVSIVTIPLLCIMGGYWCLYNNPTGPVPFNEYNHTNCLFVACFVCFFIWSYVHAKHIMKLTKRIEELESLIIIHAFEKEIKELQSRQ